MRTETDVSRTENYFSISQAEPFEDYLGVACQFLERRIGIVGRHELHQFDFLELVLTNHAACVLAV